MYSSDTSIDSELGVKRQKSEWRLEREKVRREWRVK